MNIYSTGLFHILRGTGILPVSQRSFPLKRQVITYNRVWMFYSFSVLVFLLTICVTQFILFLYNLQRLNLTDKKAIDLAISVTNANSSQICSILCLSLVIINIRNKITILEEIKDIDFILRIKLPSQRRIISYVMIMQTVITIVYMGLTSPPKSSVLTPLLHLCKLVVACSSIEFMELVLSIKDRLRLVKKKIVEIVTMSETNQLFITTLPFIEICTPPKHAALSVKEVKKVHWSICKVVKSINGTYGLTVVVLITTLFVQFVQSTYSLFLQLSQNGKYDTRKVIVSINGIVSYLFHLYVLVWPCTLTVSEFNNTLPLIIRLMTHNNVHPTFSHLETFAKQLLQRRLEFSAHGLFSLQASVVISVVSAVTNYMAIVIQVQSSVD